MNRPRTKVTTLLSTDLMLCRADNGFSWVLAGDLKQALDKVCAANPYARVWFEVHNERHVVKHYYKCDVTFYVSVGEVCEIGGVVVC